MDLDGAGAVVNGQPMPLNIVKIEGKHGVVYRSGGRTFRAVVEAGSEDGLVTADGREFLMTYETERHRLIKRFASAGTSAHSHMDIRASMPGMVVRIVAEEGTRVKRGEAVLILEAMKMENEIRSPIDGIVKELKVQQGRAVEKGDLLVVLDS